MYKISNVFRGLNEDKIIPYFEINRLLNYAKAAFRKGKHFKWSLVSCVEPVAKFNNS